MTDADVDRPRLHLTPATGWINDPLSLTWHAGEYHVFFQYVPESTVWRSSCHWGHATSSDLVSWAEQPVALAPGDGDDGIWSGSLVTDDEGRSSLFYTSVNEPDLHDGRVRIAHPAQGAQESWGAWTKGPVVAEAPADLGVRVFRDPFVFRDDAAGGWRMLVGAGLPDRTAAALGYTSPDLATWTFDGVAASRAAASTDPVWTGSVWECPQIVRVGDSDVLVVSVWEDDLLHSVAYGVGTWADGRFEARAWGRLTHGESYYAPSVFHDAEGRPGLVFWLREVRDGAGTTWSGAMSVPHLLELDGDVLTARPHPAVTSSDSVASLTVADAGETPLPSTTASLVWPQDAPARLVLEGGDGPVAEFERTADEVRVSIPSNGWTAALPAGGGDVTLLVDGRVLEASTGASLFASPVPAPTSVRLG
ncbi:Beta-fructosidase [Frondihabitans sp. 762G35]|uniref:glycoside hydrolase family 32 protein n=1 Tax=Frondihabitans sp. 762G35 TaxID=1446794 RepID=UPI000D2231E0|nr:glycoside hydrolase family 32 protein [Frondihabitans sp. 762G35]ARC56066.1 Beta-fructosidase [Frondihabitans sp. 762G35]